MKKLTYLLLSLQAFLLTPFLSATGEGDAMPGRDQGLWQTLTMIAIAVVFFYFILLRPEQKRRKAAEEQRSSIKKGDRVTAMGIIGIVQKIQDNTVILKMYDGSKIEMLKAAISDVIPATEEERKRAEKIEDINS